MKADQTPHTAGDDGELRETLARMAGLKTLPESVFLDTKQLIEYVQTERSKTALEARIDELQHITVYEIADEVGAWYEPDEGYQQTIPSRLAALKQGPTHAK